MGLFQGYEMLMFGEVIVKAIAGGWIVVLMELILTETKRGKTNRADWIQFWIALIIVIVLGFFCLPMGFLFFQ
ncbi:DUF1516 family protein [Pseudogracilibacillus auburnensis]|uniref:Uncharacterized protein DUF1516 n=1 Tax=Pseudogracilibacillus auburnensis TaxID=1494959 RepID=A0A2V3WB06_9BACI|nr:DUF1516 family protein [Pseudogracilibacillus auburnensis]PXW90428.1 uncharacterized protein DUF1516 [Pseudogracilibacillus auburnensis]